MFPSCISSSLDICHFTCAFSCFPSRSSRSVLPILASFLTFLRVFLDSLRLLLLAFFGRSVSVFPAYFHSNPLSTSLNYNNFVRLTKLWLCWCSCFASWGGVAKYWELLLNYNLISLISRSKRGLYIICVCSFKSTSPREALVLCSNVCPRYAALKFGTRVCALHCHLPVSLGAHW